MKFAVVVPWHDEKQKNEFLDAWGVGAARNYLFLEQDKNKSGCAMTKNRGIERALAAGAEYIVVLDDDCYPAIQGQTLDEFASLHIKALESQSVRMFFPVTNPASRGTPYKTHKIKMPVAASMGFWNVNPDLDAIGSLLIGSNPEGFAFAQMPIFGHYFAFSGMNFCFHKDWAEEAVLINVPRFDDIWMGLIWQRIAYRKGYCFNLKGPVVNHVRQSNVWKNLQDEARYLEINETLWQAIHSTPFDTAPEIRQELFGFLPEASQ